MAPKIAAISSMVRLIGWIRPVSRGRGGRVGSIRSLRQAGVQFGGLQLHLAGFDGGGQRVLQPVQRRAALPPLLGRGLAQFASAGRSACRCGRARRRGRRPRRAGRRRRPARRRFRISGPEGRRSSSWSSPSPCGREAGGGVRHAPPAVVRTTPPATPLATRGGGVPWCRRLQRRLHLLHDLREGRGVVIGDGGQHLAVHLDARPSSGRR